MMQPTDTVLTRMYNQPTIATPDGRHIGALYKNPIDCLWKTLKAEGPFGWYKGIVYKAPRSIEVYSDTALLGSTAHFLRIVPHTYVVECVPSVNHLISVSRIVTLTANDIIVGLYKRVRDGRP